MSIKQPGSAPSNGAVERPIAVAAPSAARAGLPDAAIALSVYNVSKVFGKEKQGRPWLRRNGHSNGAGEKTAAAGPVIAVDNVSLTIKRGEIFGVLGPNGSGKSTLIRCISTLLVPDRGEVKVFGYDVQKDEMAVKRLINRVSVEASFFKKLSPMENLMYAARLYGMSPADAAPEARRILERLDLPARTYKQPIEDLSRGQQQKIAIARALLTSPVLLLLDEPTTGLDPRSKRDVQAFVEELRDVHDATILLTTHDMYEADALCDHVAVMHDGKVVAEGAPAELKARVANGSGREVTLEEVFMALTGKELVSEDDSATV